MATIDEQKEWIDNASYYELLKLWRFAPSGEPKLQGEVGRYYSIMLNQRRDEVGQEEHVRTSKRIGW